MNNAILTGSRVYGVPAAESDVDLVVLMDPEGAATFAKAMGIEVDRTGEGRYPGLQFEAGLLNLIVETDPDSFDIWVRGTEQLVEQAPVDRETAVALFKRLRAELAAAKAPAAKPGDGVF